MFGKLLVLVLVLIGIGSVSATSLNETEMIVRKFLSRKKNLLHQSAKCTNDDQGMHKFDRNDFYYVCHPDGVMIGMCPTDMVFNETEGRCVERNWTSAKTIRVYDESENCDVVVPNCNQPGVFPVPSNCSFYYDCQEYRHGYQQFVYRCPYHTMYHPELHRCTTMTRCYPIPYEIFDRFSGEYFPQCVARGQFRTSNDCNLYYRCIPNMDGSYFQIRYECPPSMEYSVELERCVPRHTDECRCLPLVKIISDYLAKHNLTDCESVPRLTTAVSTINTTITASGRCSCTTSTPSSECSLATTKSEPTTEAQRTAATPASSTVKSTPIPISTKRIRTTTEVFITTPTTKLVTFSTQPPTTPDESHETVTDIDDVTTETHVPSTDIPISTNTPVVTEIPTSVATTDLPDIPTDLTTPFETEEPTLATEPSTSATEKTAEDFTWDQMFYKRNKTTTATPTTSATTSCIQFASNESDFPDSDYWDKSLSRESWEIATELPAAAIDKCNNVYCLNINPGGLNCEQVKGRQHGRMMIPGYIIRYRQRSNAKHKRDPKLDAGIELRLRFPNSYRIEAIARKDLHQVEQ
ncbi:uncharacterized protein LOC129722246 isoform X2 [Wyeomyia smithii]|uniref:uncharacterized protein LOC129722246 isoform X2 n=1 Tax=Wyeomyia smithii TaxID=174621 RepID=UPI0024681650|nr:uncharacterized protein LOC129722246 isoform X2 [Wyeomyia smithii]